LYTAVVDKARELEKFLETATGDPWAATKLADMALELLALDGDIRERNERKIAEKDGKVAAADSKDKRLTALTFKTGGRARKSARISKAHDISTMNSAMPLSQPTPEADSSISSIVPIASLPRPVAMTSTALPSEMPLAGSTVSVTIGCAPLPSSSVAQSVLSGTTASPAYATSIARNELSSVYPPPPPDAATIPNPLRPGSVSSRSLVGKESISSRSFNGRKSSFHSDKEQEAFKDMLKERTTSIMRMVQDLSTEWNQKYSTLNTVVQGMETQLLAMQGTFDSIMSELQRSKTKHAIYDNLLTDVKSMAKQIKQQSESQEERLASLQTFVHDMAEGSR
jgi:hypothetical protein